MQIHAFLNVSEIRKCMLHPDLAFLSVEEECRLQEMQSDPNRGRDDVISMLLLTLKAQRGPERNESFRRFLACVVLSASSGEERGHKELQKIFQTKIPCEEWQRVLDLASREIDSPLPSPYTTPQHTPLSGPSPVNAHHPERPFPLITLQGRLAEKEGFGVIERDLWWSFSTGDYCKLESTVCGIQRDRELQCDVDTQVVAMWFDSLIIMHRDGNYSHAIAKLVDALELCRQEGCANVTVLEGRIHQRMAQNYLMKGLKDLARTHFELAKEKLQLVGRGYDKTNMFCREAKILSATEPHRRTEIERIYELALCTLEKDDAYFLASFPSVTLSKAAFHLQVAFGSKSSHSPSPDPRDVQLARQTLQSIDEKEHILIEMRRFEYDFLQAELCRLEGNTGQARRQFQQLTQLPGSEKVKNIVFLAKQRLEHMTKRD